ncbi:amidohydrolase family protein [Plantactinospora sp. KLBMP9567]|uniref:amidohydrolase family protein n=1 Tax=Plantactinospora sp. KLBMP9567 TaxID=3085900 RepID=UPI0029820A88|nr:amidohydrolase family protein [Plantactinospora sp. KLBMP9567]MDW5324034.1 amidohydrolase family protein [Plantactinospora sp. KLBMP9567]
MALHVRGVVLPDDEVRDLWLVGDRVTFTPVPGAVTVADRGFVLPGLVDAHCHPGIAPGSVPITSLDQARELARIDRDAGVLAIRDAGSPFPYPELEDEPDLPRLARAGRHIAPPKRYLRDIAVEVEPADVPAAVTEQARAGNGWVKLVGDWIDRNVGDLAPSWEPETVAAAVAAAHAAGARAAVHTFSEAAVEVMVRAGVDSVEHGTGVSLDLVDEMARRGTALVPTMINIATFGEIAERAAAKFPGYAKHMLALRDNFPAVVGAAYEAGVPIYVGTDAGGGIDHGLAAEEMLLLHEQAGMSTVDVLAAASWRARDWLGFPGLVEGGLADLVVYPTDPRTDLRVVRAPERVVLRGRVLR